jgi:heme exporter protein D
MITELLQMNGYGLYVWSAFLFTFVSFTTLYVITKIQYKREKKIYV